MHNYLINIYTLQITIKTIDVMDFIRHVKIFSEINRTRNNGMWECVMLKKKKKLSSIHIQ